MGCEPAPRQLVFSYFDLYGRGEPTRMMLNHANVQFVDDRVPMEEWHKLKNRQPYNGRSLPILQILDGRTID